MVLLLNPDTIIGEHVLKDAVSFMRSHPDAGALGRVPQNVKTKDELKQYLCQLNLKM